MPYLFLQKKCESYLIVKTRQFKGTVVNQALQWLHGAGPLKNLNISLDIGGENLWYFKHNSNFYEFKVCNYFCKDTYKKDKNTIVWGSLIVFLGCIFLTMFNHSSYLIIKNKLLKNSIFFRLTSSRTLVLFITSAM